MRCYWGFYYVDYDLDSYHAFHRYYIGVVVRYSETAKESMAGFCRET